MLSCAVEKLVGQNYNYVSSFLEIHKTKCFFFFRSQDILWLNWSFFVMPPGTPIIIVHLRGQQKSKHQRYSKFLLVVGVLWERKTNFDQSNAEHLIFAPFGVPKKGQKKAITSNPIFCTTIG